MKSIAALCGVAWLATSAPVSAETLAEAWTTALRSHGLVAAAAARRDAAERELDGARAQRRPTVDAASAFTQLDTAPRFAFGTAFLSPPLFDDDNFLTATAQVGVPLATGGAIRHGIAAAELTVDASRGELETMTQSIKLAVAEAYVGVLRAESTVAVAGSNVATLTAHADDARNRYESGAVARNDSLAASVALANAEQTSLQARNRLDLARAAYNRLLGRALTAAVELDAGVPQSTAGRDAQDVDSLIDTAIRQRHELAAAVAQAGALHELAAAARAQMRPQLALTGGYMHLENDVLDEERFWMVGLGLEWNLFDSGRSRSRAAALSARASAVAHERADLETLIALQVRRAWLDGGEAESRRVVAERAVEQAVENLEVARDRYRAGAGTNTEVLDAEALRTQSLNNLENARFDAIVSTLRLQRAIGAI